MIQSHAIDGYTPQTDREREREGLLTIKNDCRSVSTKIEKERKERVKGGGEREKVCVCVY
jgi:hypothetical protein